MSEGGRQRAPILTFHGNTGSKIANAGNTCTSTLKEYYPKWLKQSQLTVSGTTTRPELLFALISCIVIISS